MTDIEIEIAMIDYETNIEIYFLAVALLLHWLKLREKGSFKGVLDFEASLAPQ